MLQQTRDKKTTSPDGLFCCKKAAKEQAKWYDQLDTTNNKEGRGQKYDNTNHSNYVRTCHIAVMVSMLAWMFLI